MQLQAGVSHVKFSSAGADYLHWSSKQMNNQFITSLPASHAEQLLNTCLSGTCLGNHCRAKQFTHNTLLQIQKTDSRSTHSSRYRKKTNTHATSQRWSTSKQHFKLSNPEEECQTFRIHYCKIGNNMLWSHFLSQTLNDDGCSAAKDYE